MPTFITWNIQYGRGVDGRVDLPRTAAVIRQMGGADVICLQEVGRFVPVPGDTAGADQVLILADCFPGYTPFFGAAIDRQGGPDGPRQAFGNLVLTRLPALQVFHHPLPQPADPTTRHMPRQAAEVVVDAAGGPLRVITTHLEYYSCAQRDAQIERLRSLHAEASANVRMPAVDGGGIFAPWPRPASLILCGDLNFVAPGAQHQRLGAPFADATPTLRDAWVLAHPNQAHAPSCGVFDTSQWPQGSHCRDFFFVSEDLGPRIASLEVNTQTAASDHQPLRLILAE